MYRCLSLASLLITTFIALADVGGDGAQSKQALQELQDFIGSWKGNGTSESDKTAIWPEAMSWSWRFKGDDCWLALEVKQSKQYKSGELRYLADKTAYQLTLVDSGDRKLVFQGPLQKNYLTLERVDPDTKETQQLKWNTASDGDRLVAAYSIMPQNRTVFTRQWQIGMTRDGVALATGKQSPECIVTGGLGTSTVTFKGATYYVCCSGCRDAFNENPEKFIKEYEERKKKK